ncbi:MAG: alpha/beta hydrolase [Bacilli bacterium]
MKILDKYVDNKGIVIHYLDSNEKLVDENVLLYIPGFLGYAEQFKDEMILLSNHRCLSISLRGRGKSDCPQTGYSFDEQYSDIVAVLADAKIKQFSIMAHSMGVPFAIKIAKEYSEKVTKLILCDYPPKIPIFSYDKLNKNFSDKVEITKKIINEMKETDCSMMLEEIGCPVLVFQGKRQGAKLTDEALKLYKKYLKKVTIEIFHESGHELWEPDYQKFINTIQSFLEDNER